MFSRGSVQNFVQQEFKRRRIEWYGCCSNVLHSNRDLGVRWLRLLARSKSQREQNEWLRFRIFIWASDCDECDCILKRWSRWDRIELANRLLNRSVNVPDEYVIVATILLQDGALIFNTKTFSTSRNCRTDWSLKLKKFLFLFFESRDL